MRPAPDHDSAADLRTRAPFAPNFLVRLVPWHRVFLRNLADLVWPRRQAPIELSSEPASFWPDVFVASRLPWGKFVGSVCCHVVVLAGVWGMARFWPQRPAVVDRAELSHEEVLYYSPAEYLTPLDTSQAEAHLRQAGDPEYAPQTIISVPPESENRRQTIVTPPALKLNQDVALPNVVAWSKAEPAVPLEATARPVTDVKLPALPFSVIGPTPEVSGEVRRFADALREAVVAPAPEIKGTTSTSLQAPQPGVVAPPPTVEAASARRWGDLNVSHSTVVPPAPAFTLAEQRALAGRARVALGSSGAAVVPPPPSISANATSGGAGRLIALGIHPAALRAPIQPLAGNRRGTFAAGPGGKSGAAGTPTLAGDSSQQNGSSAGTGSRLRGVPPGLMVGAAPGREATPGPADTGGGNGSAGGADPPQDPRSSPLMADATPPRVSGTPSRPASAVSNSKATELDRMVFGARKFYSMTLNMPNLNSAGGSWVIRFAELKQDETKGELTAPVATQKVDPAYPIELMRHNVQGTVTLYAIIRGDGSVGEVRVLRGVDDRLDEYARKALARWHFQPATRNGSAVDLEAVVMIPFRAVRVKSNF